MPSVREQQLTCKHLEIIKETKTLQAKGGPRGSYNIWRCRTCFLEFVPKE